MTAPAAMPPPDEAGPVLDFDGLPVDVPDGVPDDVARQFFAGRVRAPGCPHYLAASERRAGFTTCEQCTPAETEGSTGDDDA